MSANLSKSTTFKRIKSKIDSDGMSVWEIESDVCHNRHRKQPFDKKYLSLALRSFDDVFQQEGYDQFQLEDRLENASLNLHLRVELIDRMQHHLKQQTSQAVQKLFNSQQQSDDQPQSKRRKIKSLQSVQSVVDDDQIESIDEDLNSIQFSMDILDNQIFLVDEKEISISSDLLIQQTTDQEIDLFRSATHQNFSSSLFSFLKIIESNFENLQTDQMDETKPIDLIPFLQLIQTPSNQTIQIENFMISHIIGSINDLNIEKSSESSQTITQTTSKDIQPDQHEFHLSADEILQIDNQQVEENMQIDSEEIQSVIEPQTIIDQTKSTKSKTKSKISKKDQTLDSIQYTDFIVLEFKSIPKTKITKQKKPFRY